MSAELLAVLLGLFSAVTLASANLAVKIGADILVGRAILSCSAALLIAPAALFVPLPDGKVIGALALAMPAHFFYQMCLVQAMSRGALSLVFPVMRGLAPLLTAATAWAFLGQRLNVIEWLALGGATAAIIAFALPPRGSRLRDHPDGAALIWAGLTAVGVSLYNATDARGVRLAADPLTFIVWLFLVDWICVTSAALLLRRGQLLAAIRPQWRSAVTAGALSIFSFGSSLYAMSLIDAAKVSALRETSVVFAAAMGALLLKEGFGARRMAAAGALATALVALQFAG
ncbi:EamA family transporter [Sphingomonas sp. ID1715]|uniref:EamA family transporter n=1 Tax=Sphingomonas sp. ID1715 TaxID=1656898 RepID=UPI001488B90D|nr:EamA family transporter [Sphingomonas sp. ID1715]NNM78183.1 EamA family transporter [Sphingomonas sp. ID1715]